MELALKSNPATDAERWTKVGRYTVSLHNQIYSHYFLYSEYFQISEAVGTKSVKECKDRFKYIVALVKKNKASNGSAV